MKGGSLLPSTGPREIRGATLFISVVMWEGSPSFCREFFIIRSSSMCVPKLQLSGESEALILKQQRLDCSKPNRTKYGLFESKPNNRQWQLSLTEQWNEVEYREEFHTHT